ncbi:TOX high mobility group box family member 4b isoform X2 [Brienomyrus brachyistius]|uniref:TOX high mobility group box family member 4b isoform X2 n=1 Tax=Brienomyrus brachyistius TaxID=42636 RepID=UPI0020B3692D|nr:TOX high mobility group box family member 4b isoform X2 [Brienomyrus brachyistius]
MDLPFYSDLSDNAGQYGDSDFLDPQAYGGYDSVNKFPGGSDNYLTISGSGHPFLSSSETFHTPSLGDEEFEIPPISLDPDSALTVSDVVSHFGEMSDEGPSGGVPGNAVVGGEDPSFASAFVNPPAQGLEHLNLGVMNQPGEGALLSSTLGMELGHPVGSQFSSSSPVTIDVPLSDMNHGLLGHSQLTTIDQSELSAQLGLSLGGGTILPRPQSPDQHLSATPSPTDSLQDEDMSDFAQTVLVESPVSLSVSPAVISLTPSLADSPISSSSSAPPAMRRGVAGGGAGGGKKGKKKKDPNEPQKPVSAYALFFRDTQAAIKGQNPSATFGEVSKIVASMWDSLGEEQKQVYKRKTEAAKKEYLKALAAYRATQVSEAAIEVMETPPSPPPPAPAPTPGPAPAPAPAPTRSTRIPHHAPEQNTITNICTSNIILDLPQVTTRSRTSAHKAPATSAPAPPTITKIVISKPATAGEGGQVAATATVPATRMLKPSPTSSSTSPAPRQPPPLQQMQNAPPPPRLQQMVHSPAPPPLQAKPRGGGTGPVVSVTAASPPPLQIKIVPAPLQSELATPIMVTAAAAPCSVPGSVSSSPVVAMEVAQPAAVVSACSPPAEGTIAEADEFTSSEMEVELTVSPVPEEVPPTQPSGTPHRCVRAGCTNPPVESKDWDREYCSNECVATHCRDVFMAWCSIRSQNSTTVT